MKLSVVTITYNNLVGLQRTLHSIAGQRWKDFEVVIVDGSSADGTCDYLAKYNGLDVPCRYVSEKDNGVYDAQNKGIRMAQGEYCYFLNAGDVLCDETVLERMFADKPQADVLYGNEIVVDGNGKRVGYCKGVENPTFLNLYMSCMKHQATFIRRSLFEKYGLYDLSYKIDADWEWFVRVIAMHEDVSLQYKNIDVSCFETGGLSCNNSQVVEEETQRIYNTYVLKRMQDDYNLLMQYPRLRRANNNKILRWGLSVIMKLAKYVKE